MALSVFSPSLSVLSMQRPTPATGCLDKEDAYASLPGIRKHLKYRGLTKDPHAMCAEVSRYGDGWAVYIGFQDSVDLTEAMKALGVSAESAVAALGAAA
jgi:hypothetical protein